MTPLTAEREYPPMIEVSHGDSEAWLDLALFFRHQKRYDEMEQRSSAPASRPCPSLMCWLTSPKTYIASDATLLLPSRFCSRYLASGPVEQAPAFKAHYLLGTLLRKPRRQIGRRARIPALPSPWPASSASRSKLSTELLTEERKISSLPFPAFNLPVSATDYPRTPSRLYPAGDYNFRIAAVAAEFIADIEWFTTSR